MSPRRNIVSLDSRLIGELTGLSTQTTNMLLTDPLGSVVATFSNTAGSAALSGNQAYGPYGHLRYNAGGIKNGANLASGIPTILFGGALVAFAIAGLLNDGWTAGLGTKFFLSWLGQGLSDLLFGAREVATAFNQVSSTLLFVLDLVKLIVDVGTAVVNLVNIASILRGLGPGIGFLGKLGYYSKTISNLFKSLAAPSGALMLRTASLISSSYQLFSGQGEMGTLETDWSNLNNDWSAMHSH